MLFVPLYFEITKNASMAEGGAYMIPAILGKFRLSYNGSILADWNLQATQSEVF